jgi:ABC-type transport system involved in Fe-S cluster assembly fused permease/ATPase subunit
MPLYRTAIFAEVAQNAIRRISLRVFEHVHQLDLAFHLSRHAGSVSRIMDRGSRGISFALNSLLFNIVPTAFEIGIEKNGMSATPPALTPAKSPNPR